MVLQLFSPLVEQNQNYPIFAFTQLEPVRMMLDSYAINIASAFLMFATANQHSKARIICDVGHHLNYFAGMSSFEMEVFCLRTAVGAEIWAFLVYCLQLLIFSAVLSFARTVLITGEKKWEELAITLLSLALLFCCTKEYVEGPNDQLKAYEGLLACIIAASNFATFVSCLGRRFFP